MILKDIDSKSKDIEVLTKLLECESDKYKKSLIQQELRKVVNGFKAEKDNAYYLNFHFSKSENYILMHDIRLEYDGLVAQIDHILIGRTHIYVLESKSYKGVVTIKKDGSILVKNGKYLNTYPNPIEQNIRHVKIFKEIIENEIDLPFRFKILGGLNIKSKVLIHPETTIKNRNLPDGFQRSDSFASKHAEDIDEMGSVEVIKTASKIISKDLMQEIAHKLIELHKPKKIDYKKRFGIPNERVCPRCKVGKLIKRVAKVKSKKYKSDKFYGCSNYPRCRYTEEI